MLLDTDGSEVRRNVSASCPPVRGLLLVPISVASRSCSCSRPTRAEPGTPDMDYVLKQIYVLYTDCALKDPFYELEMPIRCELFTQAVDSLIERVEKSKTMR